ncbi:MAG: ABC transporter ATP-binding protein [Planctomycetota bacterium]
MTSPALAIEDLNKSYGATRAVQGVSLTVQRGDIYGLLGPNGSGKTTTLQCALGLLTPDSGRLTVLGQPSSAIHRTLGKVGVVFDAPTLVDGLSCRQNLAYARRLLGHAGGRGDDEALRLTGIEALANRRAGRLSLGQRRRLSIARALIGQPEFLVLDEPLSGLDTVGVRAMLELFRSLHRQGLTLLISSHRLHEMETIVNRVAILMAGKRLREASLDELLQGGSVRLRVRAAPADQAARVLAGLPGLKSVERRTDDEFLVLVGEVPPAHVNRALIQAGCAVSALVPERITLQSAFEDLVDPAAVPA